MSQDHREQRRAAPHSTWHPACIRQMQLWSRVRPESLRSVPVIFRPVDALHSACAVSEQRALLGFAEVADQPALYAEYQSKVILRARRRAGSAAPACTYFATRSARGSLVSHHGKAVSLGQGTSPAAARAAAQPRTREDSSTIIFGTVHTLLIDVRARMAPARGAGSTLGATPDPPAARPPHVKSHAIRRRPISREWIDLSLRRRMHKKTRVSYQFSLGFPGGTGVRSLLIFLWRAAARRGGSCRATSWRCGWRRRARQG